MGVGSRGARAEAGTTEETERKAWAKAGTAEVLVDAAGVAKARVVVASAVAAVAVEGAAVAAVAAMAVASRGSPARGVDQDLRLR